MLPIDERRLLAKADLLGLLKATDKHDSRLVDGLLLL